MLIGLRYEVGGDWDQYLKLLDRARYSEIVLKDPAYDFLQHVAATYWGGIYLVNVVCASIFSWGLISFCRAQPRPWLALVVSVPYLIIVVAMGYTRQAAALGLIMLGLVALSRHQRTRYVVFVALGAAFHKSAVVMMPLAVFIGNKGSLWNFLWIGLSTAGAYSIILRDSVSTLNSNYNVAQYQSEGAGIRVAMNAVPALLFLFFRKRFEMPESDRKFWTWMAVGGLGFIPWLIASPSSTAVDRMALYWIPAQLFVLSRLPDAAGTSRKRQLVYATLAYSAAVQFVWLNFATHARYWLPYQFYPWVALWN